MSGDPMTAGIEMHESYATKPLIDQWNYRIFIAAEDPNKGYSTSILTASQKCLFWGYFSHDIETPIADDEVMFIVWYAV